MSDEIRVLLVDDDALVRSGLRMMLAGAEIVTSTAAPGACLRALVRPSWTMR